MGTRGYTRLALVWASLLALQAWGCSEPLPPQPVDISIQLAPSGSGDSQNDTIGARLINPLRVLVMRGGAPVSGVSVTWAPAAGSVTPASSISDATGIAQATWTLGDIVGVQSATASLAGETAVNDSVQSHVSFSAIVRPGNPKTLAFHPGPSDAFSGRPFNPVVRVTAVDRRDNAATDFHEPVTVAIASAPSGASLSGTTTVIAVAGVAAFTDLSLDSVAAGYSLTASAQGLPSVTSATFEIVALGSVPAVAGTWDVLVSDDGVGTLVLHQSADSVVGSMTFGGGTLSLFSGTVSPSGNMVLRYRIGNRVVLVLTVQCDAALRTFSGTLTHVIYSRPGGAYTVRVTGTKR